jgi:hypothetical protein
LKKGRIIKAAWVAADAMVGTGVLSLSLGNRTPRPLKLRASDTKVHSSHGSSTPLEKWHVLVPLGGSKL